jgi:hypothetical protein
MGNRTELKNHLLVGGTHLADSFEQPCSTEKHYGPAPISKPWKSVLRMVDLIPVYTMLLACFLNWRTCFE